MALKMSSEDYLETILILKNQKGVVRSIDVAHYMDFSKPSVSRAVTNLRRDGYLEMKEDGELVFTPKGLAAAQNIYERHTILTQLLIDLGVSKETAAADACRVEHAISSETFAQIKLFHQKRAKDSGSAE